MTTATAPVLTPRQQEILQALAQGKRRPAIMQQLGVSESVLNGYIHGLYRKLARKIVLAGLAGLERNETA